MNQACLGILHGASGFARETISGMYTLGFYAASPVLSLTHGGFSNAYQTHQNHLSSFERAWNQTTGSLFSGADFSSSTFQSFRSGTNLAFTAASIATPTNFAKAESFLRFSGSVLKNSSTVNKIGKVASSRFSFVPKTRKNIPSIKSINLPEGHMWQKASPFKNKTAQELHDMFLGKGFDAPGVAPVNGLGSYINPKNGRMYRIDPKALGRYREPNHVDVFRPSTYKVTLKKKRFGYLDD